MALAAALGPLAPTSVPAAAAADTDEEHPGPSNWLVAADGEVFPRYGAASYGSMGGHNLNRPIVAAARTSTRKGYWLFGGDGGVFAFGDAPFLGAYVPAVQCTPQRCVVLDEAFVSGAATPTGKGYYLVRPQDLPATFGDAFDEVRFGALPRLQQPLVALAPTPSGRGYWLVARDGGVFAYGDADFYGSLGDVKLNAGIVGAAATPSGRGYWLFGRDGGVFAFGDAPFLGSRGERHTVCNGSCQPSPAEDFAGGAVTSTGRGYLLAATAGYEAAFGDARLRSLGAIGPVSSYRELKAPIVAIVGAR